MVPWKLLKNVYCEPHTTSSQDKLDKSSTDCADWSHNKKLSKWGFVSSWSRSPSCPFRLSIASIAFPRLPLTQEILSKQDNFIKSTHALRGVSDKGRNLCMRVCVIVHAGCSLLNKETMLYVALNFNTSSKYMERTVWNAATESHNIGQ